MEPNAAPNTPTETATPTETGTDKTVSTDAATTESKAVAESKTVEQPKSDEPTKESISAKYAQLSKAEHQLRKQKLDLETKQKTWQTEQEALKKQIEDITKFKSEAKANPLKALETLGISLNDLTEQILNQEKPGPSTELKLLKDELLKVKEDLLKEKEEISRKHREQEQAKVSQMYNNYVSGLKNLVETDKTYEYVQLMGEEGINNIVKTVELTYTKSQKLLSDKEAASQVNAAVIQDIDNFVKDERVKRRIQEVYGIKFDEPKESGSSAKSPKNTKTLTNSLVNDVGSAPAKVLSDEERLEKALSVIRYASN